MPTQTHAVRNWIIASVAAFAPAVVTETEMSGSKMTVHVGSGAIEVDFSLGVMTQVYSNGARGMNASKNDQKGMKEIIRRAAVYAEAEA